MRAHALFLLVIIILSYANMVFQGKKAICTLSSNKPFILLGIRVSEAIFCVVYCLKVTSTGHFVTPVESNAVQYNSFVIDYSFSFSSMLMCSHDEKDSTTSFYSKVFAKT